MSVYRMSWPILDSRTPLADLLGVAMLDAKAGLVAEDLTASGPATWTITTQGRLTLVLEVPVGDEVPAPVRKPRPVAPVRPLAPCGTHAAFTRHKNRGEDVDELCRDAERAYQRARVRPADHHAKQRSSARRRRLEVAS